ncbi:MAG: ABC transporter permease subunit [Acidimicrobiia bacterium]
MTWISVVVCAAAVGAIVFAVSSLVLGSGEPGERSRAWTIARTDLLQLRRSRDFYIPMAILAGMFFVVLPTILLFALTHIGSVEVVHKLSQVVGTIPKSLRRTVAHKSPATQASYAAAVYLFAPIGVIIPLTVSAAVGANTIIGERERGSGEFLAHSPATEREIYTGKLIASLIPGYVTALVGFTTYSVLVNLLVGPGVGHWFFPTTNWWILVLWVVPPFIALAVALILVISARVSSAAAAQQASSLITLPLILIAYGISSGSLFKTHATAFTIGGAAWIVAILTLARATRSVTRERMLGMGSGG